MSRSPLLGESLSCTHNFESVDFAVDTDFPNLRIHILIAANECNKLDVGGGGASEWLELWAPNSGKRMSLDPHLVWVGRIVWTWHRLERQENMGRCPIREMDMRKMQ